MKTAATQKNTNPKKKKNNMRCRKENVRTAAGNDRACHSDLLSAVFQAQRCKEDEVKSTLCLCDLFSYHFLREAAAREQDKLAFWPPALWARKKQQQKNKPQRLTVERKERKF